MTKPRKPGRTEKEVTQQVLDAAALLGIELKRRNVGAMVNPHGRTVRFGETGDSDWYAQIEFGPLRGRLHEVEIKREGFDPRKVRGAERERFLKQLEKLRRTNEAGGVGFWVRYAEDYLVAMRRILAGGVRVEFDADGFPWLTDDKV
jgi:hypothetical protein